MSDKLTFTNENHLPLSVDPPEIQQNNDQADRQASATAQVRLLQLWARLAVEELNRTTN